MASSPREKTTEEQSKKAGQPKEHTEDVDAITRGVEGLNLKANPNRYSYPEMETLLRKAMAFLEGHKLNKCEYLYRNKSRSYFKRILKGSGIMDPLTKDMNGDPRGPINRVLPGVFFCANVHNRTGEPIPSSPFGPRRILIKIKALTKENLGLYFADFYCPWSDQHYVQLVLVPKPSVWKFKPILQRLVKLDIKNNPFFCTEFDIKIKEWIWKVSSRAWIEILYLESIDIEYLIQCGDAELVDTEVNTYGEGGSGIVKNPKCKICNIP